MISVASREPLPVAENEMLSRLFHDLSVAAIDYAVLRNHEQLPFRVGARDVDIVVTPAHIKKAVAVVVRLADELGYLLADHYADERLVQMALAKRTPEGLDALQIDFFTCSQVYGVQLLPAQEMLKDLRWHHGIPVVSEPVMMLDKWLFHLAVGQPTHAKYDGEFETIVARNWLKILEKLVSLFGYDEARRQLDTIRAGKASGFKPLPLRRRLALLVAAWKAQQASGHLLLPRFVAHRLRDRLWPHGLWLSVSGPDGAGKTTVIELVLAELAQVYGADALALRGHFRPSVLPRIAELAVAAGAMTAIDHDYSRPHRGSPSGFFGSLARLSYYLTDYLQGYRRLIRPALVARRIVLFDRYYCDVIADPGRSRIRLPAWLLRGFALFIPMPRFRFFISVRPELVRGRKQELTREQIEGLNTVYADLVRRGLLIEIPNDGVAQDAASSIVDTILIARNREARSCLRTVAS